MRSCWRLGSAEQRRDKTRPCWPLGCPPSRGPDEVPSKRQSQSTLIPLTPSYKQCQVKREAAGALQHSHCRGSAALQGVAGADPTTGALRPRKLPSLESCWSRQAHSAAPGSEGRAAWRRPGLRAQHLGSTPAPSCCEGLAAQVLRGLPTRLCWVCCSRLRMDVVRARLAYQLCLLPAVCRLTWADPGM